MWYHTACNYDVNFIEIFLLLVESSDCWWEDLAHLATSVSMTTCKENRQGQLASTPMLWRYCNDHTTIPTSRWCFGKVQELDLYCNSC